MTSKKIRHLWLFHFLADFAAVASAYYSALLFRFHSDIGERFFDALNKLLQVHPTGLVRDGFEMFYVISAPRIISYILITVCILYALLNLYSERRFVRKRPTAWNIIVANVIALALFYAYFYLKRNVFHPRSFLGLVMVLNIFFCVGFRGLVERFLHFLRSRVGYDNCPTILVGSNGDADFINWYIEEMCPNGAFIVKRIAVDSTDSITGLLAELEQSARDLRVDLMIVADKRFSVAQIMQLIEVADRLDMSVKVLSHKMDVLVNQARVPVDIIRGTPLVHFEAPSLSGKLGLARRGVTFVLAGIALVVAFPLMALITLLIKLTSRGPVFFVQERIGVNRKPFQMLKFRTMYDRAHELQAQIEEFNESGKGLFKIKEDKRVTPIGRFLRRFSLDELPQLVNVMRGEMVLVGPRPLPRRDFENYYEEWHYSRHSGMPGLTCLWQVSGRSDLDFHDMCILDVFYLTNRNWVLDLRIVLKTFWAVLFAKGAY